MFEFDFFGYAITSLFLLAVLYGVYDSYRSSVWKNTYWRCTSCDDSCHASSTFGNILDDKKNWTCYHCNSTNYVFKKY